MTPADPPDDELATRAAAGDGAAFAALAERHRPGLVRCAALLTGDTDEAESVAQEALARAFAAVGDYRPATPFFAWVRGFVLNLSRQHLRRLGRHAKPTDPHQLAPAPAAEGQRNGVLSGILRDELSARLWLAVGGLPEAYREAVVLHYAEGLDYDQISALTGVSAGALRVRALRARNLLRGELGPVVDTWMRGDDE
ncbi:MAG: RNA polymerase sigma factor [Gemmataceae bacterium]|nr:RNA polymerase sigma factor [Gemmataceae bacterium]